MHPNVDNSTSNSDVAIIVPVFNEERVVREVLADLLTTFPRIIAVDDGSLDDSATEIVAAGAVLVRHPVNLGQGAALQTGIERALLYPEVRYLVTFDSDGQHDPADALGMVELMRAEPVDIVLGSRFLDDRSNVPASKRIALALARFSVNASTGLRLTDAHNGLRAFSRRFAETLHLRENGMAHASEIVGAVAASGLAYREFPVHIAYTEYSVAKGQSIVNGVNILFDSFIGAFRRK